MTCLSSLSLDIAAPELAGPEGRNSPEKCDVNSNLKPDVSSNLKPDVNSNLKPDMNSNLKPDVNSNLKPDVNSNLKPDVNSDAIPDDHRCSITDSNINGKFDHTSSPVSASTSYHEVLHAHAPIDLFTPYSFSCH